MLTYQTSGIFNFAHGAVAFVTAYFFFQLNTGLGCAGRAGGADLGTDLRPAARPRPRPDPAAAPRDRAGVRADRRDRSACSSRCPRSRCGWSRRSATRCSTSGSQSPPAPAAGARSAASGPFPREVVAPRLRSGSTASRSTPTRSRSSSPPRSPPIALWLVLRHTRLGLEMRAVVNRSDLAGLRGVNASRTSSAAWVLTMMLAGLGGHPDRPAVPARGPAVHPDRARARSRRWRSPGSGRSRSRSPADCSSASCRTSSTATATPSSPGSSTISPGSAPRSRSSSP